MPIEPDIAVLLQSPFCGGVEQRRLDLIKHFVSRGLKVDVLFSSVDGPLYDEFLKFTRVLKMRNPLAGIRPVLEVFGYPSLKGYIRRERPRSVLSAGPVLNYCAVRAKRSLDYENRVVISEHISIERSKKQYGRLKCLPWDYFHAFYKYADAVVGVSAGLADELVDLGVPSSRVHLIYNPVVSDSLFERAKQKPAHDWHRDRDCRLVLGVGRLHPQKGFEVLLRAIALVREEVDCRLMIIGDGTESARLEQLVAELNLSPYVTLPGYMENPLPYMANSDVYVLSSWYEGLGNTLVEAMALGAQVVSTDCPSGPSEILDKGRFGRLVPVGDVQALAEAIVGALVYPSSTAEQVRWAKQTFSVDAAAEKYLALLLR